MRHTLLSEPRVRVGTVVVIVLLAVAFGVYAAGSQLRHSVADLLGVQVKNQILVVWTEATAARLDTADLAPMAHDDVAPYAVNVFLDQEVQTDNVARSLDLVKAMGFQTIKQELVWANVERPAKGQYQDSAVAGKSSWATYDRIVELAQARGIQVIFRIDTSPAWARPGTTKIETPPVNYTDYGDFVAAVVQRYQGRVHYYQIWNEPNWSFEWGDHVATPAEYTNLLMIAYERAKAVDPSVVILSASLAPTIENSDRAISDVTFLQEMYKNGAAPYFDVLSVNAYGLRNGPDDWRFNRSDDVNFSRPVLLRQIMVDNGDATKPIWASEIGWDALPPNWTQYPLLFGSVSRQIQAQYTVRAYQRAAEQWPWMDVMAVWHLRKVQPSDAQSQDYYFDLVGTDWKPELVYFALQALTAQPPVVYRGYHQETYWAFQWSAAWQEASDPRAVLNGYKQSDQVGSELDFNLDASWLDLVAPEGPQYGALAVEIDGNPYKANRLPIVNGMATLSLNAASETWQNRLPIADNLGPGIHHVRIFLKAGRGAIDGVVADRELPPDQLAWHVAWAIIGFGSLVVGWRCRKATAPAIVGPGQR
jgi:hypothetical protein